MDKTEGAVDTEWIDEVMMINTAIVVAQADFADQVARLVAIAEQGKNTTHEEALLASYQTNLRLLRVVRGQFIQDAVAAA